jgi:tetratricopeptide (TPR) repeat protein
MRSVLTATISFVLLAAVAGPVAVRSAPPLVQPVGALDVPAALALYDRGEYSEFISAISTAGAIPRNLFKNFEKDAGRWVNDGQAPDRPRRAIVAASVAIEIAHVLHHQAPEWPGEYLVWAVRTVRQNLPPVVTPAERCWYLAAAAGMEELETDDPWALPAGRHVVLRRQREVDTSGGLLALAEARVPDEPRFKLARVEALEFRLALFDHAPAFDEFIARRANAADVPADGVPADDEVKGAILDRAFAIQHQQQHARVPDTERAFEALDVYPALRAEAALHAGFLLSTSDPERALTLLRRVPSLTGEAYLTHLSHYFAGRTLQRLGKHAAAIAEFEQALRIVPNARTATALLCVEFVLTGGAAERERAAALLNATDTPFAPPDPWALYYHGDARLWPVFSAQLRQALR